MDGPGAPDRVWRSIKDLAAAYSRLPAPPPVDQMERDLQAIIHENLGRDVDRRLIAFYIRELQELTADACRTSRAIHGEVGSDKNGAESSAR
jgi:hypothetical protein